MKKISHLIVVGLLFFSALTMLFLPSVNAVSKTVTASTGNRNLGGVATIRVDYSINVNLNHPSTATKGSTTNWVVDTSGGSVTVTIAVAGQSYSKSFSLRLGEEREISVATGVKVSIMAAASAQVAVNGPASSEIPSLYFSSGGSKSFSVTVDSDAEIGETVSVSMPFYLTLKAGLKIDLVVLKREVAQTNLGTFSMNPTVYGTMSITEQEPFQFDLTGTQLYILTIPVFGSAVLLSYIMLRKGQPKNQLVQGTVGIFAGLLTLVSLFQPWIIIGGSAFSGLDIGEVFAMLIDMQIVGVVTMILLLLSLLMTLGGFLHIIGYMIGKELTGNASGIALFFSVILAFFLGFYRSESARFSLEIGLWLCITGAVLGLISVRLER